MERTAAIGAAGFLAALTVLGRPDNALLGLGGGALRAAGLGPLIVRELRALRR
jgi:hypothetical protein